MFHRFSLPIDAIEFLTVADDRILAKAVDSVVGDGARDAENQRRIDDRGSNGSKAWNKPRCR